MWYKNVGTRFFRFVTIHAFDRQTDRRTDRRAERPWQYRVLHYMQSHGKNEVADKTPHHPQVLITRRRLTNRGDKHRRAGQDTRGAGAGSFSSRN